MVTLLILFAAAVIYYNRIPKPTANDKTQSLLANDSLEMSTLGGSADSSSYYIKNVGTTKFEEPIVSPKFDPSMGFPANNAAKLLCVKQWQDGDAGNYQVDYHELNLDSAHEIGDGGSCVVYRSNVYGMPCAIKALSIGADPWEAQQFEAEVKLLTSVHHPYLCRLYACSTNGSQKCLVLELMDGSLDKRLMAGISLGWEQRTWIALSVCRALDHLHSQSPPMIHR